MRLFIIAGLLFSMSAFSQTEVTLPATETSSVPAPVPAQEPAPVKAPTAQSKHMITFGNSLGFNSSSSSASAETDDDLGIKDFDVGAGNISLNYHYSIAPQFQLGVLVQSKSSTSEIKYTAGGKLKSEDNETSVYLIATWNFQEDLANSFYLMAALGKESYEEKERDTSEGTKTEVDYDINTFGIGFGKRFALTGLGIQNLTYSPSIQYMQGKISGDLEDSGVESLTQLQIDFLKFDLLF